MVLDNVRLIDGSGAAPIESGRIVITGGRITAIGPAATTTAPAAAERVDLSGKTVIPGLIDLHFHIENDPRLALRQLSHGVTAFRDPGQWNEKFVELRRMVAADGLPGPRIFTPARTSTARIPPTRPTPSWRAIPTRRAAMRRRRWRKGRAR